LHLFVRKSNPGPPAAAAAKSTMPFGMLNARSARHRTALIHDVIADHLLDGLMTQSPDAFFIQLGSGNSIINVSKELNHYQDDFGLPDVCSTNARDVVETLKGNAGLDATKSAGIFHII